MNVQLVAMVALAGWLILAFSAYRSHQISGRKTLVYVLVWASIFLAVAMVFAAVGG